MTTSTTPGGNRSATTSTLHGKRCTTSSVATRPSLSTTTSSCVPTGSVTSNTPAKQAATTRAFCWTSTSHPQNVHDLVEREVFLEAVEEQCSETDPDDADDGLLPIPVRENAVSAKGSKIAVADIRNFVESLCASVGHWFNSFYPYLATNMSDKEKTALDRLNRIGIGYFRPLVMVILKTVANESGRIEMFRKIERFIFIAFRLGTTRSNYRSSEFHNLARALGRGETTLEKIAERLDAALKSAFNQDGTLRTAEFRNLLFKKFEEGVGYYGWSGLRYFLYEYEQQWFSSSRQHKVDWTDLLKSKGDRISIEHIYPQTPTPDWEGAFGGLSRKEKERYAGSLNNLLLLSKSINSSLQNDAFAAKKNPRFDGAGDKMRNGYSDGSHSEIEVAANQDWCQIRFARGACGCWDSWKGGGIYR